MSDNNELKTNNNSNKSTMVDYGSFENASVVGGLQRFLLLDKSQFTGLPSDTLQVKDLRVSLIDNDGTQDIHNVSHVTIIGQDIKALKSIQKSIDMLPANLRSKLEAPMRRTVPNNVTFRIDFAKRDGTLVDYANANYDWLTSHSMFSSYRDRVISGIKYGVTWEYATRTRDKLALRVTNLATATAFSTLDEYNQSLAPKKSTKTKTTTKAKRGA